VSGTSSAGDLRSAYALRDLLLRRPPGFAVRSEELSGPAMVSIACPIHHPDRIRRVVWGADRRWRRRGWRRRGEHSECSIGRLLW